MDWEGIIGAVAPTLGTALLGPFGGLAAKAITGAVFGSDGVTDDIEMAKKAIMGASPEQLASIKKAEQDFEIQMRQLEVDVLDINRKDRDSARKMQKKTRSWVVPTLGVMTVGGFFGVVGWVLTGTVPTDSTILGMIIGAVSSKAEQVYNFFFGSSDGSKEKTEALTK